MRTLGLHLLCVTLITTIGCAKGSPGSNNSNGNNNNVVDNCDPECAPDATCTDVDGAPTCVCNEGWEGDGVTCTDVDECAAGTDDCDENATCDNTEGSYDCTCTPPYVGDGWDCQLSVDCSNDPGLCDANATCTPNGGGYNCICNEGYEGDGASCTDIDECLNDPCDPNATCTNIPGTFGCSCNAPCSGDGLTCTCPLIGPVYDITSADPGDGYTWSITPTDFYEAGNSGGVDISFVGLTVSDYSELYWGPACVDPQVTHTIQSALDGTIDDAGEDMVFQLASSDLANGVARWVGTTTVPHYDPALVNDTVDTRFTVTVTTPWMDAASVAGLTPACGAAVVYTVSGDFTANLLFEAKWPSDTSWTPMSEFFDALVKPDVQSMLSFDFGFWYRY